jgi:flagellar hook-basal body complex protein FliE
MTNGEAMAMMPSIQNVISPPSMPTSMPTGAAGAPVWGGSQGSFKDFLLQAIDQANAMQQDADRSVEQLLTGGDVNPAEVLTAVQKADLSFRMMLQVRNKLLQAFQEIKEIRI